jgi:transcription-repair coupling factor (superfamily II helicase)
LHIGKHNQIDPANIIQLIQSDKNFRLQGADKLQVKMVNDTIEERIRQVKAVLKLLQ